jgi:acetyl-CoA synthetase
MEWERIRKRPEEYVGANLVDYDEGARAFSWTQARGLLDGLPGGGLNIAYEAIDRHVKGGRGDKLALRWIGRDDTIRDFTYAALGAAMNRFANVLAARGIGKGDGYSRCSAVPGSISPRNTLKNSSVFSPFFPFGPSYQGPNDDRRCQRSSPPKLLPPQIEPGGKNSQP